MSRCLRCGATYRRQCINGIAHGSYILCWNISAYGTTYLRQCTNGIVHGTCIFNGNIGAYGVTYLRRAQRQKLFTKSTFTCT